MKAFLMASSVLLLAACGQQATTQAITADDLQGRWVISGIAQSNALTQHVPWIVFENDSVSGYAGCNNFMGSYQLEKQTLSFGQLASTRKYCEGPEMAQEDALLKLLSQPMQAEKALQQLHFFVDDQKVLSLTKDNQ